nr:L-rhamnose mutarotase [uncultured Cohaesibacter sp.]
MKRDAFKMKLIGDVAKEYQRRHAEIWPELIKLLKDAGISDYAIYFDETTNELFAVQTVSAEAGAADLGAEEIVQKWWTYMADIMVTNPDDSPVCTPLKEVFYLT